MKIGFFVDNRNLPNTDYSTPQYGSPGVGAASYMHAALPYFMKEYAPDKAEVVILAPFENNFPKDIQAIHAPTIRDAAKAAKDAGCDYFVFRARQNEEDEIFSYIDEIEMPSISTAQLIPNAQSLRKMAKARYYKALVSVGLEQHHMLMDTPIASKTVYIDNAVHAQSCYLDAHGNAAPDVQKDPNLVVYMGALVPTKGFHQLAQAWPQVLKRNPQARLSVIGSVKVYGENLKVGPLGVAEESYERNHIIPHLCDENGQVHPSVTFHGQLMGEEKLSLIRKAAVGVVNPTGQTEYCCVSALEIFACKTPVVTGAYYALLDTVWHEKTGLLGRGAEDLAENINTLLENPTYAAKLAEAGYQRILEQYDFAAIIPKWVDLFEALNTGKALANDAPLRNIMRHYKFLRMLNSVPQATLGKVMPWPSVMEAQEWAIKARRSLKNKLSNAA